MDILLVALAMGVVVPPYHPTAGPYEGPIAVQPLVTPADKAAELLIHGVSYLRRLPGPVGWFRCPWCGSSTDLMFLGEHLRTAHGLTGAELDRAGYRRWPVLHDNLHNIAYKPPAATNRPPDLHPGCAGGLCPAGPLRRLIGRWR
jgi:hypothetical protein